VSDGHSLPLSQDLVNSRSSTVWSSFAFLPAGQHSSVFWRLRIQIWHTETFTGTHVDMSDVPDVEVAPVVARLINDLTLDLADLTVRNPSTSGMANAMPVVNVFALVI